MVSSLLRVKIAKLKKEPESNLKEMKYLWIVPGCEMRLPQHFHGGPRRRFCISIPVPSYYFFCIVHSCDIVLGKY